MVPVPDRQSFPVSFHSIFLHLFEPMKTNLIQRSGLVAAFSLILTGIASAQFPAPNAPESAPAPLNPASGREAIIRFEVISLPPLTARKALIKYPKEPELYAWLDAELEKKESGVVLERMNALRVRTGQRSKIESIDENAYPTEFDPPQIPQTFGASGPLRNGSSFPGIPTTPY